MSNKKSSTSFLVQGSILAMASIISRIIGLVYRIPLTAIIGNKGNDYYGCAFEIYNILLIISSYSLLQTADTAACSIKACVRRYVAWEKEECIPYFEMCADLRTGVRYDRRIDPILWG